MNGRPAHCNGKDIEMNLTNMVEALTSPPLKRRVHMGTTTVAEMVAMLEEQLQQVKEHYNTTPRLALEYADRMGVISHQLGNALFMQTRRSGEGPQ